MANIRTAKGYYNTFSHPVNPDSDHTRPTFLSNAAGEPYQFVLYLPFGELFAEQRAAEWSTPYLFNAKELDTETGLYYYGARYYDPRVSTWWGVDPLAGKYPGYSPYTYVANNPIIFIDPDGREIGVGKEIFNSFKDYVTNKMNKYSDKANNLTSKANLATDAGKFGRANSLMRRANNASTKASQYGTVLKELNALEDSDQMYNIFSSSSNVSAGSSGNVQYDLSNDAVNVNIKDKYNQGALAHELKHAYQFEIGALSFSSDGKSGGSLYDLQDEVEAYNRGHMFGYPINPSMSELKTLYPGISSRTSQLTLDTPTRHFDGANTMGDQLKAKTKQNFSNGKTAPESYRNWKSHFR